MHRPLLTLGLLVALAMGAGCTRKESGSLEQRWAERNYRCAVRLLDSLEEETHRQVKELKELGKKVDTQLLKADCPIPKHPECNIQLGIKGAATYFALGGYIVPEGTNSGAKDATGPKVMDPESLKEAEELVKRSKCHTTATPTCPTLAMLRSLSDLLGAVDNAVEKEDEIRRWYLRLGRTLPDHAPVRELRDSLKNLEEILHDLARWEQVAKREGGDAKRLYHSYHPDEVRAVTIDVLGVAAEEAAARLATYFGPLGEMKRYLRSHKDELLTKVRTRVRRLQSGPKLDMEECLRRRGCRMFRSCMRRMRLPGLFVLRRTYKGYAR